MKAIITSGGKYTDIDTLACGLAYKELLDLTNIECELVLPGPLNESVSKTVRSWDYTYLSALPADSHEYNYILVDISDPNYFAPFVVQENITEVYDHRWGFEEYWKEKLGENSHIEMVGSCATLIWEQYKLKEMDQGISAVSANLLYTAILSNTLNFNAQITTQRDIDAAKELTKYTSLPINCGQTYFHEIEESVMADPIKALVNDTKETKINNEKYRIGQIELWDNTDFIAKNQQILVNSLNTDQLIHAFITSPNISKGYNTIICTQSSTQQMLSKALNVKFDGNLGKTDKLWLRKEIIRELAK